jgi:hypothetical protein
VQWASVATHHDQMAAIEVKAGAVFREDWCKGLRAFGSPPSLVSRIVVCPGTPDMLTDDGIEILSYRRFARMLRQGKLFARIGT